MTTLIRRIAALEEERRSLVPEPITLTPEEAELAAEIMNRMYADPIRYARRIAEYEEACRQCREGNG